ncbi:MAG: PIG-L family deacetylase [Planctomycetes bacterium]|nr:PIG-L family deacetylase [Planctomycetota bacterium]
MGDWQGVSSEFLARQRLLIISPHADDESYGCAGTIGRMKDLGAEVFVVCVSVGDLAHYSHDQRFVEGRTRVEEFSRVMEFLRVDDWDILYTDAQTHERLDRLPRRELIEKFEATGKLALDRVRPTMLALPAISYNQDHEAVFRAGFTAARPGDPTLKAFQPIVLAYDNTALFWSLERERFHPNLYVDITGYLDRKLQALEMHASQRKASVHHASLDNVRHLALTRGREVSTDAAEGYQALRWVL